MCVIDVSLFECGDYSWQQRGPPCSESIFQRICSRHVINTVAMKDHACANCFYIRSLEGVIHISERMLRFDQRSAALAASVGFVPPLETPPLPDPFRSIQEMKTQLQNFRARRRRSLMCSEGTELDCGTQVLSIAKFRMEEMRSVLLADDN
jgi:hypothetical protein